MIQVDLAAEPLPAGVARSLDLVVANRSGEHVLLDEVTLSSGRARFASGPALAWKRRPDGVIAYDTTKDRYVHSTDVLGVSSVPLHTGVVPPGARAETLLQVRLLASATVQVTVSYRVAPDLAGRVYSAPRGVGGKTVVYSPGFAPGPVIVREGGLEPREARLEAALVVEGAAPEGAVARSKALGWLGEGLRVDGRSVLPEVVDALDALFPGDPIVVIFAGERGMRVRAELGVDLNPARQGLVAYEKARDLVLAAARHEAALRVGLPWEGLVVGS
jgi:hypothetical protein